MSWFVRTPLIHYNPSTYMTR